MQVVFLGKVMVIFAQWCYPFFILMLLYLFASVLSSVVSFY